MGARSGGAGQPMLPGLDDWIENRHQAKTPRRRRNRAPDVERLAAKAPARVRRLFKQLRDGLVAEAAITERVLYDDSTGAFAPSYLYRNRELLRLHLDPVLAATVTLERGEAQLARLLDADSLSAKVKTQALKRARRSGKRVFLAFLARTKDDVADLLAIIAEHLAADGLSPAQKPRRKPALAAAADAQGAGASAP